MALLWPGFLVLLGLIPVLVAVYILMLRRRRRFALRYSSLSLVRQALPRWTEQVKGLLAAFLRDAYDQSCALADHGRQAHRRKIRLSDARRGA